MRYQLGILMAFGLLACTQTLQAQCIEGDCENGWGKQKDDKGRTYKGHFKDGQKNGKGIFYYTNGDRYEGDWENGLPHGQGIRFFPDGSAEGGRWEKGALVKADKNIRAAVECISGDCRSGYGKSKDAKGRVYVGNFKNNLYEGAGSLSYPNGERFEGNFQAGLPNGKGAYYYKNGHVDSGDWEHGKLKDDKLKVWAVVAGVADYKKFTPLTYTTEDARKVYAFLRSPQGGAVPEDQIKLLLDEEATSLNIQNTMADLYEQADSNDLIIFYFAGHGKEGAFLPYDFDGKDKNLLYHAMVNTILMDSKAKFKICIADACHSSSSFVSYKEYTACVKNKIASGMDKDKAKEACMKEMQQTFATRTFDTRGNIKKYYDSFKNIKGGLALIMSSAAEEISLEASKLKQGVFSYFLIQGLRGSADENENGIVTIRELYNYLSKQVENYTYKYQHPALEGEFDDNMPVGILQMPEIHTGE